VYTVAPSSVCSVTNLCSVMESVDRTALVALTHVPLAAPDELLLSLDRSPGCRSCISVAYASRMRTTMNKGVPFMPPV